MRSVLACLGAAVLAAPIMVTAASAQDAQAGREVFERVGCYTCHGYEGQGAGTGPRLAPNPLPYEAFSTFVRQTAGDMPPFTPAVLSDEDLRSIHAYLESVPQPPDPADIPLLQNIQ